MYVLAFSVLANLISVPSSDTSTTKGFNATYNVNTCPHDCLGHRQCVDGHCVCEKGWGGINCEVELCPKNCSYNIGQGMCNLVS